MENTDIYNQISSIIGIYADADGKYPFMLQDYNPELQLCLIHYNESNIGKTSLENPLREHRGTIIDLNENKIVCGSIGYIPEIVVKDANFLQPSSIFDVSGLQDKDGHIHSLTRFRTMKQDALGYYNLSGKECFDIVPTYDGTNIRVWKYKGKILISTNKKIDASNSKWGVETQTFEQLFYKCAENSDFYKSNLLNSLDKGLIAYFIILNKNLNHGSKFPIGCDNRDSVLVFMGYRYSDNTTPSREEAWDLSQNYLSLTSFATLKDTCIFHTKFLEESEVPIHLIQGYNPQNKSDTSLYNSFGESITILYEVNGRRQQVRFVSPAFESRVNLYDNQPNIFYKTHEIFTEISTLSFSDYLNKYPPIFDVTNLKFNADSPIFNEIEGQNASYTIEDLKNNEILRFRNAMSWYAMSLNVCQQRYAIEYTNTLLNGREILYNTLLNFKEDIYNNTLEFPRGVKFPKEAYEYVRNGIVKIMNSKMNQNMRKKEIKNLAYRLKGNFLYQILSRYMYIEYGKDVNFSYNWLEDSRYESFFESQGTLPCSLKTELYSLPQSSIIFDIKSAYEI